MSVTVIPLIHLDDALGTLERYYNLLNRQPGVTVKIAKGDLFFGPDHSHLFPQAIASPRFPSEAVQQFMAGIPEADRWVHFAKLTINNTQFFAIGSTKGTPCSRPQPQVIPYFAFDQETEANALYNDARAQGFAPCGPQFWLIDPDDFMVIFGI